MKNNFNYHHLYYFKEIVDNGNISNAATKLDMAQPTLSAQIKSLEASLGFTLFHRKGKQIELTPKGNIAYEYAKSIFDMGTEMLENLQAEDETYKPNIVIGAIDSVSKDIVAKMVKTISKESNCKIKVIEGDLDFLINELTTHKIELVVSTFLPLSSNSTTLKSKRISHKSVNFYGPEKYKELRKDFPRSIGDIPLIFPAIGFKLRNDLENWAKLNQVNLNISYEVQDVSLKKLISSLGLGIFASAAHTVSEEVKNKQLVKLGSLEDVFEEVFLITCKKNIPNPVIRKVIDSYK